MNAAAPWFEQAFGSRYLDVYSHRSDETGREEVRFAVDAMGVSSGSWLLDAGCGAGRHSRAFAAHGARVVGVDLSADLLRESLRRGGGPRYARADLRRLPLQSGAVRHVASLFTTFGYFDDAGNATQLAEFRRVTSAGGTLLLDFLNAPRVRRTLVARSERRAGDWIVREARRIESDRVVKDVEVVPATTGSEGPATWSESVRLYGRADLESMIRAAGYRVRSVFGDLAGGPWSEDSDRLILLAEAP